jgi:hypothetical protein
MWQVVTSPVAAAILMVVSFLVFLGVQTIVYRMRLFQTMGRNLFMICLLVHDGNASRCIAFCFVE